MNILSYRSKAGKWHIPFCVPDDEVDNLVASQEVFCKNYDLTGCRLYRVGRFENGRLIPSRKVIWRCK